MKSPVIAILGARGQLGAEIAARIPERFHSKPLAPTHQEVDLTRGEQVAAFFEKNRFDVLINCTAYNQVEAAQTDSAAAFALNASAVENLARLCNQKSIHLIH